MNLLEAGKRLVVSDIILYPKLDARRYSAREVLLRPLLPND
jgi:hypothetical protein